MRRRAFLAGAGGTTAVGLGAASLVLDGGGAPTALVAGSLQSVASRVPGANVEAHGSVACRRYVLDGLRDPDALALADSVLFEAIHDRPWLFATNALVVAANPDADLPDDWQAVLAGDYDVGMTDPDQDPLGYRTVLALRLSEFDADEVLASVSAFPETSLLRTLEAGGLDAAFCYRNMAVDHDLPSYDLPAAVDFSDPSRADHYATVSYDLGDRTVQGAPIRYGAAALTDAGTDWVQSLVADERRLRDAGFSVPDQFPRRA